jgi:tripartite-type tricarboxylate transporter receptor subunit TctC
MAKAIRRRPLGAALAVALTGALAGPAAAQSFPERPVRIIVPYAPGGGTDVVARVLAATMTAQMPQTVLVENRAGAGGMVGAEAVARSAPDGHTILFTNTGHSVLRLIAPNPSLDIRQALSPVAIVSEAPMIMMAANNFPAKSLQEFVSLVRANPGRYDYGSTGTGGTNGLTALMFLHASGLKMNEIPYRGGAPATLDLAAGRIAMLFDASSTSLSTTRGGQARALAVTTAQRSPSAPELPTLREAGVDADMSIWMGMMIPSATPPALRQAVHQSITRALADPGLRARFAELGTDRIPQMTPAECERFVSAEIERWEGLLQRSGYRSNPQ